MDFKEKVEAVKRIPIPMYMKEEVVPRLSGYYGSGEGDFSYGRVEKCPMHNEDTASFRYYEETNSCYCFGCSRGGDVINLHRQFFEVNEGVEIGYKTAVDWLYKKYIEHGDAGDATKIGQKAKTKAGQHASEALKQGKEASLEQAEDELREDTIATMRFNRKASDVADRLRANGVSSDENVGKALLYDLTMRLYRLGKADINSCNELFNKL